MRPIASTIIASVITASLGFGPMTPAVAHSPTPSASAGQSLNLPVNFPVKFGGAFDLVDHDGKRRTDKEFRGRFMLVYFGYTQCADICPNDLQVMSNALEGLGDKAKAIQPVFITADPLRDTPAHLKSYLANFHPAFIGLTGSEAQIRAAAKAYRVHRLKVTPTGVTNPLEYLVSHGSLTYLMNSDGQFVTMLPHGTDAPRMAAVIGKYVN